MSHETQGRLCEKFDSVKVSEKLTKREFVIETQEQYPQQVKFELVNDKCGLLDAYQIGNTLKVSFNLRGRKWNNLYFVNLNAWKIERERQSETRTPTTIEEPPMAEEDLPF